MTTAKHNGLIWVGLALILLSIIIGQAIFFADINLRNDEILTVHAADTLDAEETLEWMRVEGTHPLGWTIFAMEWVRAFDYDRDIVRYHSTLFTILALALIFRLGRDLFDGQVGLIAVVFVGIMPFAFYHHYEFRPYSALTAISAAYLVVYLHWLVKRTRLYDFLFIFMGAIGLQIHFYFGLLCVSVIVFHFLCMERQYWQIKRLLIANAIMLASIIWWVPTVFERRAASADAVIYNVTVGQGLLAFVVLFNFLPLFVLLTPLLPVAKRFPAGQLENKKLDQLFKNGVQWRIWYPVIIMVCVVLISVVGNIFVRNMSPRNFLIILPVCAVAVAYGLRVYVPAFRVLMLGFFIVYSLGTLSVYYFNVPYAEITQIIEDDHQANDKVILYINSKRETPSASMVYYLVSYSESELESTDIYSIVDEDSYGYNYFFHTLTFPYAIQRDIDAESLANFGEFLGESERFWLIEYIGDPLGDDRTLLNPYLETVSDYEIVYEKEFERDGFSYRLYLYNR